MELDQLKYFLVIAQQGGFSPASRELGITQPALSRSIAKLEEELGQPVFERDARPLSLTEAGQALQKRAVQILGIVDQTLAEITDDDETGKVRVGAIPTIAPYSLPWLASKFHRARPKAAMILYEEVTTRLLERIRSGELDVAIMALPIEDQYLEVETLFEEELYLMRGKTHPLASLKRVTIEEVQKHPMLLLDQAHCLSEQVASFCRQRSLQPIALERVAQLSTVQELVAIGHGCSFIPAMARSSLPKYRNLYRSLNGHHPKRTVVMVTNSYRFQSKLVKTFVETLRQWGPEPKHLT